MANDKQTIEAALLAAFDALPNALPSARDDVLLYARDFQVRDGVVEHVSGESPSEYLAAETKKFGRHSHWVAEPGAEFSGDKNPWSQKGWNLTNQSAVVAKYGAERAAQISAEAGSKIGATKPSAPLTDEAIKQSKNPWSESGWNVSRQGAIARELGVRAAAAMAASAGCKLGDTRPAGKPVGWSKQQTATFEGGPKGTVDVSASNPFTPRGYSLTKIAALIRDNPQEAARLATAAGTTVEAATSPAYAPRRSLAGNVPPAKGEGRRVIGGHALAR